MINVDRLIKDARKRYKDDGVTLSLPTRNHSHSSYTRASSLGLCPLMAARQKLATPSDYPKMADDEDRDWLMDHGNYVAPMVQIPLLYYASITEGISFQPELPFEDATLEVAGRLDGLLTQGNEKAVIEIKDTEGKTARSVGEPTLRYVWQTLVYMKAFNVPQGAIVTVSKWTWTVWDLLPVGKGYQVSRKGTPYAPKWGENWNNPKTINDLNFHAEVQKYRDYLEDEKKRPFRELPVPIQDPLNDPMGWLCVWQDKPTTRTPMGTVQPNCQWCKSCHGLEDKTYKTFKLDGEIRLKE